MVMIYLTMRQMLIFLETTLLDLKLIQLGKANQTKHQKLGQIFLMSLMLKISFIIQHLVKIKLINIISLQ